MCPFGTRCVFLERRKIVNTNLKFVINIWYHHTGWAKKSEFLWFFGTRTCIVLKMIRLGAILCEKIDCAHSWTLKMLPWLWFRERLGFWSEIPCFSQFQNPIFSLNQAQGSIFRIRECAPHKITPYGVIFEK